MCTSVANRKVDVTTVNIQQIDCEIIKMKYESWWNDLIGKKQVLHSKWI